MGRRRKGWRLRRKAPGCVWTVRFTIEGSEQELSTGHSHRREAEKEADRLYARAVSVERPRPQRARRGGSDPIEELVGRWIASLSTSHQPTTLETWEVYAGAHFIPHFGEAHHYTTAEVERYIKKRLGEVMRQTLRKELTALRSFIAWGQAVGVISSDTTVPPLPQKARGKRYKKRRRVAAAEVSPAQVQRFLRALPEWSEHRHNGKRFPVRARFIVAYETTLRPATLDQLSVPEHYHKGATALWVTRDIDKEGWERRVPLTPTARRALDRVCPEEGLLFGAHDYRWHVKKAAAKAFPEDIAKRFTTQHLRSAGITHLLDRGANISGVQHMAGQKHLTTTTRYQRPSERAALEALGIGDPRKKRRAS